MKLKKSIGFWFLLGFTLITSGPAQAAHQVRVGGESSASSKAGELGYSWSRDETTGLDFGGASISAFSTRSDSTSSSGNTETVQTKGQDLGFDFEYQDSFSFGVTASSLKTVEVGFSQSGATLAFDYRFDLVTPAKKSEKSDDAHPPFVPWMRLGLDVGESKIKQDLDFTILSVRYQKTIEIKSQERTLSVSLSPVEGFQFRTSGTFYSYDRSFDDLSAAVKSRLLTNRASGLVNTILGLVERSYLVGADYDWTLNVTTGISVSQNTTLIEKLKSQNTRLSFSYYFDPGINLEISYSHLAYEETSGGSIGTAGTSGILAEFEF